MSAILSLPRSVKSNNTPLPITLGRWFFIFTRITRILWIMSHITMVLHRSKDFGNTWHLWIFGDYMNNLLSISFIILLKKKIHVFFEGPFVMIPIDFTHTGSYICRFFMIISTICSRIDLDATRSGSDLEPISLMIFTCKWKVDGSFELS